jgi:hypothetical protein
MTLTQYRKNPDGSWMNFNQIVDDFWKSLDDGSIQFLQDSTEDQVRSLHHSAGMTIRNVYGLWEPSHPLTTNWSDNPKSHDMRDGVDYSKDHPDAVSNEILAAIWRKANGPTKIKE